jgi:hypothetical protein
MTAATATLTDADTFTHVEAGSTGGQWLTAVWDFDGLASVSGWEFIVANASNNNSGVLWWLEYAIIDNPGPGDWTALDNNIILTSTTETRSDVLAPEIDMRYLRLVVRTGNMGAVNAYIQLMEFTADYLPAVSVDFAIALPAITLSGLLGSVPVGMDFAIALPAITLGVFASLHENCFTNSDNSQDCAFVNSANESACNRTNANITRREI